MGQVKGTVAPPENLDALLSRAQRLAGRSLGWLGEQRGDRVPSDIRRAKGWAGGLLERSLGASAGSRAVPDFPRLGVELKSLPVDRSGRVLESTYVCTAPLDGSLAGPWEDSWVRAKLGRVLWMPVVGDPTEPLHHRQIGTPLFWEPSDTDEGLLRRDWEELTELLTQGQFETLNARLGHVLQLRPKGANSGTTTSAVDASGKWIDTGARGFYLRRGFTQGLLDRALGLSRPRPRSEVR